MKKYKVYLLSCAAALAVGAFSALLTAGSMKLFGQLEKPPLAPPAWLFPVVWSILYLLMGVSAAKIYKSNSRTAGAALTVYALSLIFNFFWPLFFFRAQAFFFSFGWLCLLWVLVLLTILFYRRVSPWAAYLQVPYLLWLTFAAYLNLGIALLN